MEDKDIECECGEKFKTLVDLDIHRKIYHPMLGMMVKDMPVRVLLIGMAMQGIFSYLASVAKVSEGMGVVPNYDELADAAIDQADAVIKKLEGEK